jgi:hypothetical protein
MSKTQTLQIGQSVAVKGHGKAEIVSIAKGWVTATTDKGTTIKVRASAIARKGDGLRRCKQAIFRHYDAYVKGTTPAGNSTADNGDAVAAKLRGMELDALYAFAAKTLDETQTGLKARYAKLNPGMQRMNLGNRLRAILMAPAAE